MDILPTWVKGKLALLGDAAHPFLPRKFFLSVFLRFTVTDGKFSQIKDKVVELQWKMPQHSPSFSHLERYRKRYQSAYSFMRKSAINAQTPSRNFRARLGKIILMANLKLIVSNMPFQHCPSFTKTDTVMAYTAYNFGHDEWDNSTNEFKKWQRAKNPNVYWRAPVAFGPSPGPRQDVWGRPRPSLHQTFVTASIKFKTSRTFLQNLFPTESFTFKSPGTVAYASFSTTTLGKMSWLGGGGYNHFGLYIHGVQYKKKDGSTIDGTYMPILFESLTDPIVTGRDELGMPKLYCAIDIHRREKSYRMQASWQGAKFADFNLEGLEAVDHKSEQGTIGGESDYGIIVYRYIPAVGERGKSDVEYPVVVPHAEESKVVPSTVHSVVKAQKSNVTFDKMDWDALPTLHHIVDVLADIPIYEVVGAKVVEGTGVPDVSSARRVE